MEIGVGYLKLPVQPDANQVVRSRAVPQMKDSDVERPGKAIWYFEHIPAQIQCFQYSIRRYFLAHQSLYIYLKYRKELLVDLKVTVFTMCKKRCILFV